MIHWNWGRHSFCPIPAPKRATIRPLGSYARPSFKAEPVASFRIQSLSISRWYLPARSSRKSPVRCWQISNLHPRVDQRAVGTLLHLTSMSYICVTLCAIGIMPAPQLWPTNEAVECSWAISPSKESLSTAGATLSLICQIDLPVKFASAARY